MWAFVPWTGSSWSMAYSRSCQESPTQTRTCSCRYSTRNIRQTVSGENSVISFVSVCMNACCRHNTKLGESRENSNVLVANAFDQIPRHHESTIEAVPDIPLRLLRGWRRKGADGVFGDGIGRLRRLATQQVTASAWSLRRVRFVSTSGRSLHRALDGSSAALLLDLIVTEKVSKRSSPHRRNSEV